MFGFENFLLDLLRIIFSFVTYATCNFLIKSFPESFPFHYLSERSPKLSNEFENAEIFEMVKSRKYRGNLDASFS